MNGRHTTAIFLGLGDCASLLAVFNVIAFFRGVTDWSEPIFAPLILPCAMFVVAIYLIDGYNIHTDFISVDYTSLHVIATVAVTLLALLITFAFVPAGVSLNQSRGVIVLGYLTLVPLTIGYRRMWHLKTLRSQKERTIVFIGDRASATEFATECAKMKTAHSLVPCFTDRTATDGKGDLERTLAAIRTKEIEAEAIVLREAGLELSPEISDRLMELFFNGVPIYTLEFFHETYWRKIPRYRLNQIWLFQEGFRITREPVFEHAKRLADLFCAAVGLILFFPLLAIAAAAIWLEDRGPVIFAQTRIGRNRVPFRMFKLRTMRTRGPDTNHPYTREADTRITRVGGFLRSTRLDEVPQLWNVLLGDMSLIGPRAEWDRLVQQYEAEIPCYHFRHLVKPGITGWAQINYPYGANMEDTMRKLEYDLYYIRHFSFVLDATVILKTVHIMLFGKGR